MLTFDEIIDEEGNHRVPDPELVKLANEILDAFKEIAPEIPILRKSKMQFYKAAAICKEHGMAPIDFVRSRVHDMRTSGMKWATAIACDRFGTVESDHNILCIEDIRHYKSQVDLFRRLSSIYGSQLTVEDRSNAFTPLFRCMLAYTYGNEEVFKQYKEAAKEELKIVSVAKEIFKELAKVLDD